MKDLVKFLILFISTFLVFSALAVANKSSKHWVVHESEAKTLKHPKGAMVKFLISSKVQHAKHGFMALLTLPPGGKVPEHRDPTEEYLYFLEGEGHIWINDQKFLVKKGHSVYMPANAKVKFEGAKKGPIKVLQFFAPPGPEVKYDLWK